MKKILHINFKVKSAAPISQVQRTMIEKALLQGAQPIANVKGLLWKIWIMNEAEKSVGGIYLFEDDASVQAYLRGEIIAGMKSNPAFSDFEVRVFDVLPEPTKITRGPVD